MITCNLNVLLPEWRAKQSSLVLCPSKTNCTTGVVACDSDLWSESWIHAQLHSEFEAVAVLQKTDARLWVNVITYKPWEKAKYILQQVRWYSHVTSNRGKDRGTLLALAVRGWNSEGGKHRSSCVLDIEAEASSIVWQDQVLRAFVYLLFSMPQTHLSLFSSESLFISVSWLLELFAFLWST